MVFPSVGTEKTSVIMAHRTFEGHTKAVHGVIHLPGRQRIMTCSSDGTMRIWNLKSGEQIGNDWRDGESGVFTIALSPDGKQVISGSYDGAVKLWNIDTGKVITRWTGHTGIVTSVRWTQDGGRVLSRSEDRTARVWDADATRRPGQRRRRDNINPDQPLPPGFFDDSRRLPPPSRRRPLSSSSARQRHVAGHLSSDGHTLLDRLSSILRRNNHNTPDALPPLRFMEWAQNPFFNSPRRRDDEGLELQERLPEVVDVPFTAGKPKNISAAQVRTMKEKARAKKAKKARAGSSRPPQGSVTQQSGGAVQAEPTSEQHPAVATSSTTPVVAPTTFTTSPPDAMIPRAGYWTRFWLFVCCASVQYTDGHH
ncbi:WD40 repeat-like protein [Rhizopogon vinicolor AM-OR11-026]|uniref:WD40 repeat-like protein n=1 Tax=Rhizopogon vinicolor AM-OR11-026 TaxID=1314800 RepID=A0A1B7MN54_9AGAM|nr:WD40 repeat-like protein [Rhizopogon vinicolor AM-OR11-026]